MRTHSPLVSLIFAALFAVGLSACGGSVPAWGPEETPEAADADEVADAPAITDVQSLAAALKADPSLRVEPLRPPSIEGAPAPAPGLDPTAPGLSPARFVELPAEGRAADPEVLHAWLVDLGVSKVQIEHLLPTGAPDQPRFEGDGDPGVLRLRLRQANPDAKAARP